VLSLVLLQGLVNTAVGVGIGLVGAFVLSRYMTALLFGVKPTDPWVYVAVSLGLAVVALVAGLLPARRASRIDPLVALRDG
jgi:ABC-type antimicrobial peptide transport system permease subunit